MLREHFTQSANLENVDRESYEVFEGPYSGVFDFCRTFGALNQGCGSSSDGFDQSQCQQHHLWTDRYPYGHGNGCRFHSCHWLKWHCIHSALFRWNAHGGTNNHYHLHGDSYELERQRNRADHDNREPRFRLRIGSSDCFDHGCFQQHSSGAIGHAYCDGNQSRFA